MTVAMRYVGKLPRNGNLQRQQLHIFEDANISASTILTLLERFAVGSPYVNHHLVGLLYNLPRLMLMNSLNPSPQNMSRLKKPWVEVIPILLSGIFLDIPNSLDAKRFPSAGDHFKYLS